MLLLLPLACGDPLATLDYRGDALLRISGEVLQEAPIGEVDGQPSVAVLWMSAAGLEEEAVEQAIMVRTEFPSYYQMSLLKPPPVGMLLLSPGGDGAEVATGALVLYVDADGDDRLDLQEEDVIGAARNARLVWFTVPPEDHPDEATDRYHFTTEEKAYCPNQSGGEGADDQDGEVEADLVVGDACTLLPDVDCDGARGEWNALCEGPPR